MEMLECVSYLQFASPHFWSAAVQNKDIDSAGLCEMASGSCRRSAHSSFLDGLVQLRPVCCLHNVARDLGWRCQRCPGQNCRRHERVLVHHVFLLQTKGSCWEALPGAPVAAEDRHQASEAAHQVLGRKDLSLGCILQGVQVRVSGGGPHPHLGGDVVLTPVVFT